MKSRYHLLLILSIILFSCGVKSVDQKIGTDKEKYNVKEVFDSASQFAKLVLKKRLRIHYTEYKRGEINVDALFQSEGQLGYTTFSNELYQKVRSPSDLKNCILFAAYYRDERSAESAFNFLKANSQIPASDVEGMVGPTPLQVRMLDSFMSEGGLFVQQGNYVFFLTENCGKPPLRENWAEYENLFLSFITEKNEEIEVVNAECGKDTLLIQKINASR